MAGLFSLRKQAELTALPQRAMAGENRRGEDGPW